MKRHPYSFSEFMFKENNALVIQQQFNGTIKIEGYTDSGKYEFKYTEFEGAEDDNM